MAAFALGPGVNPAFFDRLAPAFRHRDFRILWTGSFLAFIAFFMSTVVQSVVAFDLSGNNRAVGFVVFAQGIAQPVAGDPLTPLIHETVAEHVTGAVEKAQAVFDWICENTFRDAKVKGYELSYSRKEGDDILHGDGTTPAPTDLTTTVPDALLVGFGKRRNELAVLEGNAKQHRSNLEEYSLPFLDVMMTIGRWRARTVSDVS